MKNLGILMILAAFLGGCSGEFNAEKIRGSYKVDMTAMMDDAMDEGEEENDLGAAFGKALMDSFEMVITFEDGGKGSMAVGMGVLQTLAEAFGAEDSDISDTPMGTSIEWKAEGNTILINSEDSQDWEVFGKVIENDGYERLVLEVDEDGEIKKVVLERIEE